jgi:hypothetical protein
VSEFKYSCSEPRSQSTARKRASRLSRVMVVRRRLIGSLLLAGAAVSPCRDLAATQVYAGATSCTAVAHEIEVKGAKTVVDQLFNSPGARVWERLLTQIEGGRSECVRLAKALRRGTDAVTGETLNVALSRALETNPSEVLALWDDVYPLDKICQDSNIEPTPEQHRKFVSRARAGLVQVREPALVARKNACLRNLGR